MRYVIAVCLASLFLCGAVHAQQQIPQASLEKLQGIFGDVRDQLWTQDEDYWHRGEFNRCIATLRLITQMDPRDTEAYIDAAWLMDSDLREEDAEAFLREGLANNTDTYDMYLELGNFCYFRERYDEAIVFLTGAVTFDCPPFVWHQLAHAYEHAGRVGDCLEAWFEAQAMEPDNGVPPMQIDRILAGEGPSQIPHRTTEAIQHRKDERAKGIPN